ncbi:MAG: nucleoside triphosphate pyrophosphohydrolase [Chloroflexi bacterium]|nr:nucleoside triphosphate pyrophosphohydrolase [Chloroflexota bacterium]
MADPASQARGRQPERAPGPESLDRFDTLRDIIARLRAPNGCPWDREQTHATLKENLLQECYEVLEALDEAEPQKLSGELGDLLMQIMLHAQIASEAGEFELEDVLRSINTKLIRRHPHVFGDAKLKTAEEVLHNWEAIKKGERVPGTPILTNVPRSMPALSYSQEIQERAARVGFDWKAPEDIIDKLVEEIGEFKEAEGQEAKEWEFGDLLFVLVNIARRQGVDSETALRQANERFRRRFEHMEKVVRERGQALNQLSFDELNALWDEAKKHTNEGSGTLP